MVCLFLTSFASRSGCVDGIKRLIDSEEMLVREARRTKAIEVESCPIIAVVATDNTPPHNILPTLLVLRSTTDTAACYHWPQGSHTVPDWDHLTDGSHLPAGNLCCVSQWGAAGRGVLLILPLAVAMTG